MRYKLLIEEKEVIICADTDSDSDLFYYISEMYKGKKVTLTFDTVYMGSYHNVPALFIKPEK